MKQTNRIWSSLHQLGFETIMPDNFMISHEENPSNSPLDKKRKINPQGFSEDHREKFKSIGLKMVEIQEMESKIKTQEDQIIRSSKVKPVVVREMSLIENKPLPVNTTVKVKPAPKKIHSWEKPLVSSDIVKPKKEYSTSQNKTKIDGRKKKHSWE